VPRTGPADESTAISVTIRLGSSAQRLVATIRFPFLQSHRLTQLVTVTEQFGMFTSQLAHHVVKALGNDVQLTLDGLIRPLLRILQQCHK
jgi:hypothetical protein